MDREGVPVSAQDERTHSLFSVTPPMLSVERIPRNLRSETDLDVLGPLTQDVTSIDFINCSKSCDGIAETMLKLQRISCANPKFEPEEEKKETLTRTRSAPSLSCAPPSKRDTNPIKSSLLPVMQLFPLPQSRTLALSSREECVPETPAAPSRCGPYLTSYYTILKRQNFAVKTPHSSSEIERSPKKIPSPIAANKRHLPKPSVPKLTASKAMSKASKRTVEPTATTNSKKKVVSAKKILERDAAASGKESVEKIERSGKSYRENLAPVVNKSKSSDRTLNRAGSQQNDSSTVPLTVRKAFNTSNNNNSSTAKPLGNHVPAASTTPKNGKEKPAAHGSDAPNWRVQQSVSALGNGGQHKLKGERSLSASNQPAKGKACVPSSTVKTGNNRSFGLAQVVDISKGESSHSAAVNHSQGAAKPAKGIAQVKDISHGETTIHGLEKVATKMQSVGQATTPRETPITQSSVWGGAAKGKAPPTKPVQIVKATDKSASSLPASDPLLKGNSVAAQPTQEGPEAEQDEKVNKTQLRSDFASQFSPDEMKLQFGSVPGFAHVTCIVKESPAEAAGLQCGDVIVKFGNLTKENFGSLFQFSSIVEKRVERKVGITIVRRASQADNCSALAKMKALEQLEFEVAIAKWSKGGVLGFVVNSWPARV